MICYHMVTGFGEKVFQELSYNLVYLLKTIGGFLMTLEILR